jgi:hypothetical protein
MIQEDGVKDMSVDADVAFGHAAREVGKGLWDNCRVHDIYM